MSRAHFGVRWEVRWGIKKQGRSLNDNFQPSSFATMLCSVSCKLAQQFHTAGIWNIRYPMKNYTSWIFYVWLHVQYTTIRTVTIVRQSSYIVSVKSSLVRSNLKCYWPNNTGVLKYYTPVVEPLLSNDAIS